MPTPHHPPPRFLSTEVTVGALLVALTLGVFASACSNGFAYDDNIYVTENARVQTGLTPSNIAWAWRTFNGSNWHPLTWMSLQLDASLRGMEHPWIFHLSNVLLHAACTWLLFFVLCRMTGALWRSAMVAALFAVHPLHVESVAWISERKDVLSTFFWMLTLLAYVHYVHRPSLTRYILVVVAFALGLAAKPMLVTLPFVLLLLDYWPLARLQAAPPFSKQKPKPSASANAPASLPWLFWEKTPLFLLTIAASIVTWYAQKTGGSVATLDRFPFWTRFGNALVAYCAYMGKIFWPIDLVAFYPHARTSLPLWQIIGAAALLVFLSALFLVRLRALRYPAVGWLWFLGTLVPVIGLVQVGRQAMADRYTYVPLIGLFLLGTWGMADLLQRWQAQKLAAPLAAALLVLCGYLTIQQERYWFDDLTLWAHALQVDEKNPVAHNNYGNQLIKKQPTPEERAAYQKLAKIAPDYWQDARTDERAAEGLKHYRRAFELDPNYWGAAYNIGMELGYHQHHAEALKYLEIAVRGGSDKALWQFNLGIELMAAKQYEAAREHFEKALHLDPKLALAHNALGKALEVLGHPDEALREYAAALELDPEFSIARNNLASLLFSRGRLDEALEQLHVALKTDSANPGIYYTQARAYGQKGNWAEAVRCAREAVRLQPRRELYHCRLAYALAKQGQHQAAKAEYEAATGLNPKWPEMADKEARKQATNPNLKRNDPLFPAELAEQVCQGTGNREPKYLLTLAISYAAIDRFNDAVKVANEALKLATSAGSTELAKEIEQNLKRFEKGQP